MGNLPFKDIMVGFESMFEDLNTINHGASNYPPYNILKYDDSNYAVEMALAGWTRDNLEITEHNNILTIKGDKVGRKEDPFYFHKGVGHRAFKKAFKLAGEMNIHAATLVDGILIIQLKLNIPEQAKPRVIPLG